jgi:hypothetical protein
VSVTGLLGTKAPRFAALCFWCSLFAGLLLSGHTFALVSPLTGQKWTDLTPARQEVLKPLAGSWDKLPDTHKKKWTGLADRYPTMTPQEQTRFRDRIRDWAKLTPEQRRQARENYKSAKAVPPERKKAEWQTYQKLPETAKQQLAAAAPTPNVPKPVKEKAQLRERQGTVKPPVKLAANQRQTTQNPAKTPAQSASPADGGNTVTIPVAVPAAAPVAPAAAPTALPAAPAKAD